MDKYTFADKQAMTARGKIQLLTKELSDRHALLIATIAERDALCRKLDALLDIMRQTGLSECPDCHGHGAKFVYGQAPRNVIQQGGGYSAACETCGGHEDSNGSGYVLDGENGLYHRACEIVGTKN